MLVPQNHFWAGSACLKDPRAYPSNVIAISDILTITQDLGNHIPNGSWMIYLFELFIDKSRFVPLELDLFCQFDGKNNFKAVFNGVNQHTFKKVPEIGHSYQCEILLDSSRLTIIYRLLELDSQEEPEIFELSANNMDGSVDDEKKSDLVTLIKEVNYEPCKHFTGIEWWDMANEPPAPFPIRYQVGTSMLRYTQSDADLTSPNYTPYRSLIPDIDSLHKQYPISFHNLREMNGCICYDVNVGIANTGMTYSLQ